MAFLLCFTAGMPTPPFFMYILGLNAYHADSSAAIFKDGTMIAAIEEERFRRIKHWAGFPALAVAFCLKEAGIGLEQVDHIAIGRDPKAKYWRKWAYLLNHPTDIAGVLQRRRNAQKITSLEEEFAQIDKGVSRELVKNKIHYIEHHRAHLASAFFASPYEEAALLSIDGSGDFSTTMIGVGQGNHIAVWDSVDFPHSVGLFYTAFTQWMGFPHYGDEYKVMGLAPYGKPQYTERVRDVLQFKSNGLFALHPRYFRSDLLGILDYSQHIPQVDTLYAPWFEQQFGTARKKEEPLTDYHKDMAASVQRVTED